MPRAALAQDGAGGVPARIVGDLVDDAAVLGPVDEYELSLGRGLAGARLALQGVLVAAEREVKLELLDLADVPGRRVAHH